MSEERDLRGPAVIVTGGIIGGFEFCGPFDSIAAAEDYIEGTFVGDMWHCSIVLLKKPDGQFPFSKLTVEEFASTPAQGTPDADRS